MMTHHVAPVLSAKSTAKRAGRTSPNVDGRHQELPPAPHSGPSPSAFLLSWSYPFPTGDFLRFPQPWRISSIPECPPSSLASVTIQSEASTVLSLSSTMSVSSHYEAFSALQLLPQLCAMVINLTICSTRSNSPPSTRSSP